MSELRRFNVLHELESFHWYTNSSSSKFLSSRSLDDDPSRDLRVESLFYILMHDKHAPPKVKNAAHKSKSWAVQRLKIEIA
jgi:hypothetical protein